MEVAARFCDLQRSRSEDREKRGKLNSAKAAMKKGILSGLAMVALAVIVAPSMCAAQSFNSNFTNNTFSGPYLFHADGPFVDANGDEGHISLNAILSFDHSHVAVSPEGIAITIAENGTEAGFPPGTSPFQGTCTTVLEFNSGISELGLVSNDGVGFLDLSLKNGAEGGNDGNCFNTSLFSDVPEIRFNLTASENRSGTNYLISTRFKNLCMTGSFSGVSNIFHCAAIAQDSIETMSLNGTLVHQ
jgi:hypothetical protein